MVSLSVAVDHELEWWRPLVSWLVHLPKLLWGVVLSGVSIPVHLVAVACVLATGRRPEWIARFHVYALEWRAVAYGVLFALAREPRASFDVTPVQPLSRADAITRPIGALPHVAYLLPIGACLDLLLPVWLLVAAVNRGWPTPLLRTLVAVERWVVELILWGTMTVNEKPAFGLAAHTPSSIAATA
ncbi:MAG TPA: hypothetical protein VEA78_03520 [Acidimicrobiales bacterium]|nr:hypothetical protein [Acidimicrobiales bacterium]